MLTTTPEFDTRAVGQMRPLGWRLLMSFEKEYIPTIDFFTVGVSYVGGDDIIKGSGDVIQEWDKYRYTDYTDRLISAEWTRELSSPYSVAAGMLDITLDNHDYMFTPNGGSSIADDILPRRPVKFFAGFGTDLVSQFIGLTEKMPEVDETSGTVKFHCVDFLYSLFNKKLDQAELYENAKIDVIIGGLLEAVGILPTQYDLEPSLSAAVPYAFFDKGTTFGDAASKLMEAELGVLYLDEVGVIRMKNRQSYSDTSVYTFNNSNTLDARTTKQDNITNVVEVKSDILGIEDPVNKKKVFELSEKPIIPPGGTVDVWADFSTPVKDVTTPTYIDTAVTSAYSTNANEDGSGANLDAFVSLTSTYEFSKSYKATFSNSGAVPIYLTSFVLFGYPITTVSKVFVSEQDDDSVDKFEEQINTIENPYIQTTAAATSLALLMLNYYASFDSVAELDVKGNMALQLDDTITVSINENAYDRFRPIGLLLSLTKFEEGIYQRTGDFAITKITNHFEAGGFDQTIGVRKRNTLSYFTVGVSYVGGGDVIAP